MLTHAHCTGKSRCILHLFTRRNARIHVDKISTLLFHGQTASVHCVSVKTIAQHFELQLKQALSNFTIFGKVIT